MAEKKTISKMEELQVPLSGDDVEFRIGSSTPRKGFSLLLYKTARTDVNRLNNVFGLQWKNKYFYDEKKYLACEISVFDEITKEWVGRSDVGTESNTEKEKGSYSDAMKRAGSKWGIGIELYKAPFIWVNWDKWKNVRGKDVPDVFMSNWTMEIKKDSDGILGGFSIKDGNGKVVWSNTGKAKNITEPVRREAPAIDPKDAEFACKVCKKPLVKFKLKENYQGVDYKIWECDTCKNDKDYPVSHWEALSKVAPAPVKTTPKPAPAKVAPAPAKEVATETLVPSLFTQVDNAISKTDNEFDLAILNKKIDESNLLSATDKAILIEDLEKKMKKLQQVETAEIPF